MINTLKKLNPRLKAVIFDWDGTLYDSMDLWNHLASDYLKQKGIKFQEDVDQIVAKMTLEESANYFKKKYAMKESSLQIRQEISEFMENRYVYDMHWKANGIQEIKEIKKNGILIGIATSSDSALVKKILRKDQMETYIDCIVTCEEVQADKTKPNVYEEVCKNLRVSPFECIVVEDEVYAYETAKKAGFLCVLVS